MTPSEVKAARLSLGFSPLELGKAVGLTGKNQNIRNEVCRWERDPKYKSAREIPELRQLKLLLLMENEK